MKTKNYNQGFVVLTSVIILSIVLLMIAETLSTTGYFQGSGVVALESKEQSYWAAMSCIDRAYFTLSNNPLYTGDETMAVGSYTCHIDKITTSPIQIQTNATVRDSTTNLQLTLDEYFAIVSFREL